MAHRKLPGGSFSSAIAGFFLGAALLFSAPSHALDLGLEETKVGLRLSVAEDFVHAPGSVVVSTRYGGAWGAKVGVWARDSNAQPGTPNFFAGVDYMWTHGNWHAGLGTVWIDETNSLNGTHWDFDVSAAYDLTGRVFVEYRHFSHGRKLGIKKDASNGSWNLIGVGLVF